MTIQELQEHAKALTRAQGWEDTAPEQRALWLVTEVGELIRELLQFAAAPDDARRAEVRHALGREMYDVVWNVCDLANVVGIRLEAAFAEKAELNQRRRW